MDAELRHMEEEKQVEVWMMSCGTWKRRNMSKYV
jgi:hypothetical protein